MSATVASVDENDTVSYTTAFVPQGSLHLTPIHVEMCDEHRINTTPCSSFVCGLRCVQVN
jgi:hypothetical protein